MKKLFYSAAILSLFFIGLASSGEDSPVPTPDTPPTIDTKGIIEMTEGVGDWTTGYVTPVGYFFYDNNVGEAVVVIYDSRRKGFRMPYRQHHRHASHAAAHFQRQSLFLVPERFHSGTALRRRHTNGNGG